MSDSNIIINIVEPGSPVTPNTGLFSQGLDGGTIATISIVSFILVASIISLAYYYHKHHKLPRFTSSIKAFKLKQAKKQLTIGLSIIALLTSAFTFAGLKHHSNLGTANAAEGGGTNTSLDLTVSDVVLDVELADEPVFAVAPVTLTVAEATTAGYTLKAYAEDTTLSSTETDQTISMITLSEEAATSALSDNTWGLATEEPEAKDNEIFYSLPESAADAIILTDKDYKETSANDTTTVYLGFYITPDLPYGTYTGATVDYSAEENAVATVTFDGNGLYFNDDKEQTTNTVKYVAGSLSETMYSHTPNVNDEGVQTSGEMYPLDSNETFVYSFENMDNVHVDIVKSENDAGCPSDQNDYFSFWAGSYANYTAKANYESGIKTFGNTTGKYVFGSYARYESLATDVEGNAVTFAYTTSNSRDGYCGNSGYGYYAKITGYNNNEVFSGEYETPATTETEDYEFLGWSTDPNAGAATYTANDLLNPNTFTIDRSSSITLYAIWRSTTPFNISYNGNGATGSMESTESEQTETLSHSDVLLGDTANLYSPNYKKTGYGFVGWSADNDAWTHLTDNDESNNPKIYGPNQTIIVDGTIVKGIDSTTNTSTLYAVWAPAEMNGNDPVYLQNWTGCSAMTATTYEDGVLTVGKNTITALTDSRDGEVYTIAKLADGNCWMTENLRLDNSVAEGDTPTTQELSTTNTNHPSLPLTNDHSAQTTSNRLSISSNNWCTSYNDPACYDQSIINTNNSDLGNTNLTASYNASGDNVQWYSYGNNYNWYSATAGNGKQETGSNVTVEGDLCPAGWQLPYGGSGDGSEGNNKGNTNGGFYYLNQQMGGNTSSTGSNNWRSFPNNFVYSGYWYGSSAGSRGSNGYYWSSTASDTDDAYELYFDNGNVGPGAGDYSKYSGDSVRCLAPAE